MGSSPFLVVRQRTWCRETHKALLYRFACTKFQRLFAAVHLCYGRFPKLSNKSK